MADAMKLIPLTHPLREAWEEWRKTAEFENARAWVGNPSHMDGSLWAVWAAGYQAATERAGNLHESINPASDRERQNGSPGAGAMGAVIEYRDSIRTAR